jgi:hypothetical protein
MLTVLYDTEPFLHQLLHLLQGIYLPIGVLSQTCYVLMWDVSFSVGKDAAAINAILWEPHT